MKLQLVSLFVTLLVEEADSILVLNTMYHENKLLDSLRFYQVNVVLIKNIGSTIRRERIAIVDIREPSVFNVTFDGELWTSKIFFEIEFAFSNQFELHEH